MQQCTLCSKSFQFQKDESAFLKKMDFVFGSQTIALPASTHCPDCRNQIRTSHRNEQYLYQRKSDLSGKQTISIYDSLSSWDEGSKIYTKEEWESDTWDAMTYGRDFDFSRPFFEQFTELQKAVPRMALITVGNENSAFTTGTGYCKNCYLINSSEYCEDCYYGKLLQNCKDSIDSSYLYDSERCYQCFNCQKCYNCVYVSYSQNSSDCWFSENLSGCRNCFFSTNLTNKAYYFMNEPLDKAEYERRIEEFKGSHANFQKAWEIFQKMRQKRIHKYSNITHSENCTGDFIQSSQNCQNTFDMNDSQDCRNVWVGVQCKDVYDCSNMYIKPELNYQVLGTIETFHVAYSLYVFHSQNILYSDQIHNSKDLFGCVGLKNKQYCILNKQYTREAYEALVPKIIEHMRDTEEWGLFFPPTMSPHGYNESLASEYYPLSKEEVEKRGWHWHEDKAQAAYQGPQYEIPNHLNDVPADITERILKCEATGKLYKIIPQELKLYKSIGVPIPRLCPDARHKKRMQLRNVRQLANRKCDKCEASVHSTYAPNQPERIYCEKCYVEAVY